MIYRKGAFDHFDTICCVGPHHEREIRATESLYGLPEKTLVSQGYPRLDTLLGESEEPTMNENGARLRLLVAPSWGPNGMLETCGEELVQILLDADFHVTVRPHPMTRRLSGQVLDSLMGRFDGHPLFAFEEDVAGLESLLTSNMMISDWSGAALEYSFSRERPVLFLDLPRKVNNPEWNRLGIEPLEASIREEIGAILAPDRLTDTPAVVESLIAARTSYRARIRDARSRYVFNLGQSAEFAADYIAAMPAAAAS
jgi:YidC/Oxa1 family membrane protein insertase